MRFQQKQQHEIQQKRSEMAISRNITALDINDNSKFTASLGAGKVQLILNSPSRFFIDNFRCLGATNV